MNHHNADYGADQLSDAQKHRRRVFVDRCLEFREYQDSEGLQGGAAAERADEEGRAHQDKGHVERAFGVGSPDFLLIGIGAVGGLLDRLADRLKFVLYLRIRRACPTS